MTEILSPNTEPIDKNPPELTAVPPVLTAEPQSPGWVTEGDTEKVGQGVNKADEGFDVYGKERMGLANSEASTLRLPVVEQPSGSRKDTSKSKARRREGKGSDAEGGSMRSDSASLRGRVSRTESEREFGTREKGNTGEGWKELMEEREREHELGLWDSRMGKDLEIEVEQVNSMPEKAAGVFSPVTIIHSSSVPGSPRESAPVWEGDTERSPFLGTGGSQPDAYYQDWSREAPSLSCGCTGTNRDGLKVGASVFTSALIFPLLVWGGYVFLPFDAPLLDSAPLRLVYTLRCSVFAVIPIVLGVLVLGVSRLRHRSLKPLCEGEAEPKGVNVHRRFVDDSISLFLLYFLQLAVMANYLGQGQLKLIPLLTIIFTFGRLVYWIAAAWGNSVRGFGYGFSFLPMVTMLVANLYFIFTVDSAGSIFAQDAASSSNQPPPVPYRQRFWG
ncbi:transmembrane protein 79 [Chanos chanos]|uniref:Transmembrane protein 79 n=1 Tax=Chanos chanos TaxID=29144 RepID=A0A6J2W150_CHACN|nr:transmembrane protein 79-like [Chanos chanos]